jgi:hypothetical protein
VLNARRDGCSFMPRERGRQPCTVRRFAAKHTGLLTVGGLDASVL